MLFFWIVGSMEPEGTNTSINTTFIKTRSPEPPPQGGESIPLRFFSKHSFVCIHPFSTPPVLPCPRQMFYDNRRPSAKSKNRDFTSCEKPVFHKAPLILSIAIIIHFFSLRHKAKTGERPRKKDLRTLFPQILSLKNSFIFSVQSLLSLPGHP